MRSDVWLVSDDVAEFLGCAGDFLGSRPALHTMQLTAIEKARKPGAVSPLFGRLVCAGEVRATYYGHRSRVLTLTALTPEQADTLAAHQVASGNCPTAVSADEATAAAFAGAWRRHTGATPALRVRIHLYRLGTLTPPVPAPAGYGRLAGDADHERVMRWCREFAADVGEAVTIDASSWAGTRFADKRYTFWTAPGGADVSMAGVNPLVAGQVRVDPVYTPAHLRGRGYAGAVTVAVSRAALEAGATDVVLFADPNNPASNTLYRRIGFRWIADWAVYEFAYA
jgi:RimJ/RimL family protein N-acetyltransferase